MPQTFVLVHGAWHGGWCWRRVADRLRAQGHVVFTPTMPGLGERAHLPDRPITLDTHIADIANLFKWERLSDVVLCGHSYAGFVVSGVAELISDAIRSIVFLDAFVPENGDSVVDVNPVMQGVVRELQQRGETWIAPRSADFFGVNENDRAWVDALMVPQPLATFTGKMTLTGARERIAKKTYIRAASYASPGFDHSLAKVKADPTWRSISLQCHHDVMVDMPERLTELLIEAA